jgi:protein-S-isoprenylcysteine O-methyltransferase Ste14
MVVAMTGLSAIFTSGADRWLWLAPGTVTVAVLYYSSATTRNAKTSSLAGHPFLTSIAVVNFILLGLYATQIGVNLTGSMSGAAAVLLNTAIILFFGLAIVLPYWELNRIRLELIQGEQNNRAAR